MLAQSLSVVTVYAEAAASQSEKVATQT